MKKSYRLHKKAETAELSGITSEGGSHGKHELLAKISLKPFHGRGPAQLVMQFGVGFQSAILSSSIKQIRR